MVGKILSRMQWEVSRQGASLGWAGALGVMLIVFAAAFYISAVKSLKQETTARREEATRLNARLRIGMSSPAAIKPGLPQQLHTFYEFFPPPRTLPDWLARLNEIAGKHGLALERGEYKWIQERGWRLQRYQMILPVKGNYEQIRAFVADLLVAVPALAVNEITLKREGIAATTVEAQIKLTLFLGAHES